MKTKILHTTGNILATTGKLLDTATTILDTESKALPGNDAGCRGEDSACRDKEFAPFRVDFLRILLVVAWNLGCDGVVLVGHRTLTLSRTPRWKQILLPPLPGVV